MYVHVDISRTIPTTLFLKTKYLTRSQNILQIPSHHQFIMCSLNTWLIPRMNIQKSNLYCNGFIITKLIYWSEHTHSRPGWRPKSLLVGEIMYSPVLFIIGEAISRLPPPPRICDIQRYDDSKPVYGEHQQNP